MEEVHQLHSQLSRASKELNFSMDMLSVAKKEHEALRLEQKENAEELHIQTQALKSLKEEYMSLTEKLELLEMELEKRTALNDTLPLRQKLLDKEIITLISGFNRDSARTRKKILSIVNKAKSRACGHDDAVEATVIALRRASQTRGENQVLRERRQLKVTSNSQELSFLVEAEEKLNGEINSVRKSLLES
jgi:hypothetical protein